MLCRLAVAGKPGGDARRAPGGERAAMRILHYRRRFSQLSETFIHDHVVEQRRLGADARVATVERLHADTRPLDAVDLLALRPTAVEWVRGVVAGLAGARREETERAATRRALESVIRDRRPDVVHAHFGNDAFTALPVARATGVPLVVGFYGYDVSSLPRREPWKSRYRELVRGAAAFAVLSAEMRDAARDLGIAPERIEIVHVGRRLEDYPYRVRRGPVRRLVSVGRLTAKKGHDDALRAFAGLRRSYPEARLTIVGDGELAGSLRRLATELRLGDSVDFAGACGPSRQQLVAALEPADAFVLASKTSPRGDREGTPTVLLEAQAMGLPCVATRHAGIPEVISPRGQRLLAPEGDPGALEQRLRELAEATPAELAELSAAGLAHVRAAFALEPCCRAQLALYARVAGR